ncbi:hypothetical protein [Pantoea sp. GD03673]|nr:hypothetical protein [Pantoea sp. GD03673]MDH2067061.1 hypothetical protein [Pantoea sp. GD03673]
MLRTESSSPSGLAGSKDLLCQVPVTTSLTPPLSAVVVTVVKDKTDKNMG